MTVQTHSQDWVHRHQVLAAGLVEELLTLDQIEHVNHVSVFITVQYVLLKCVCPSKCEGCLSKLNRNNIIK